MKKTNKQPPSPVPLLPEHQLFTTAYLMQMLSLKANAVYRLCAAKLIDHYKINNMLYFDQPGIDDFMQRHKVKKI